MDCGKRRNVIYDVIWNLIQIREVGNLKTQNWNQSGGKRREEAKREEMSQLERDGNESRGHFAIIYNNTFWDKNDK